jgi:hypothetical protein
MAANRLGKDTGPCRTKHAMGFRDRQSQAIGSCPKVRLSTHHGHSAYFRLVPISLKNSS